VTGRFAVLLGGLLALLAHLPAWRGEFLSYDDARFVVRNRSIESLDRPWRFWTDLSTTASEDAPTRDIYRPLRTFSFAVLTALFGKSAAAFHLCALLLHALTAALLVALLMQAGLSARLALAGGLLFGIHPVTVEATAWVCSLGDLECGLFSLLAMLFHARRRAVAAHVALLVALFGKEHAVVVPGLWLAWDYFLARDRLQEGFRRAALPGLAICVAFLWFRGSLGAGMAQVQEPLGGSHPAALRIMLAGLGYYAGSLLLPFGSSFDARVPPQQSLLSLPVLVGIAALALLVAGIRRGTPRERFGLAWFVIALVPVSNLIVPLKIPTADRFLYLPLMGVALASGDLFARRRRLAARALPVAFLALALLTMARTRDWRDDRSLAAAGLRVHPKSRTWLWAEAAQHARDALQAIRGSDLERTLLDYNEALRLYGLLARNSPEGLPTQVLMEVGELQFAFGLMMERIDRREEMIGAYGDALRTFLDAHRLQRAGIGRVIEEEVVRAAEAAADLCQRLADPENPDFERTVKVGTEMLTFLQQGTGRNVDLQRARFLLAFSIHIRSSDPAKAREGFEQALKVFTAIEERDGLPLAFPRAQCVFYASVLTDRPMDDAGLERAFELYHLASTQSRENLIRALFHAGRVRCTQARLFGSAERAREGRDLLESLPEVARRENLRVSEYLRRQIDGELHGCTAE